MVLTSSLTLWTAALADLRCIRPYKVRSPVRLPGPVVVGKSLLPTSVIMIDLVPHISDSNRPPIILIFSKELTMIAGEAPNHRHIQLPCGTADPIDRPLALFLVEGAQCQSSPTFGRKVQLVYRGHAIEVK